MLTDPDSQEELLKRLKKIEGQVRGLQRMILQGRSCQEIFSQFAAINGAMRQVAAKMLEQYIEQCLKSQQVSTEEIREGLNHFIKTMTR